jgi:nitrilase
MPTRIAAVQAAPVLLDRAATIEKARDLIRQAAKGGANLVVFPEAFIPCYPFWVWAIPPKENRLLTSLYAKLVSEAVTVPGPAIDLLAEVAKEASVYVVVGVNEINAEASGTTLYNTLVYLGPDGRFMGKHRKLVPTAAERMVWGAGDGSTLDAYDTQFGKIGGLICWENYMPLARYAMYCWGVQILLAPTWDEGEPWLSTLRHIGKEGRCHVVGCSITMNKDHIPNDAAFKHFYSDVEGWFKKGDTAIVDPDGKFIAGPVREREEILFADLNLETALGPKWKLDVAGHYARPDVFRLIVNKKPHPMLELERDIDEKLVIKDRLTS